MLIGRKKESEILESLYQRDRAELVAIYGRRRVGKTYLVNEVFKDRFSFHHTGLSPYDKKSRVSMTEQLQAFHFSLLRAGLEDGAPAPKSWLEAFFLLQKLLIKKDDGNRQVVFIDELPWIDTPKSHFLTAFENFWNDWGSRRHNLFLVICGSSTTWILDNIINNPEGFYGRITYQMHLQPFSLKECLDLLEMNQIVLSPYDVTQGYMALGGIPYYWGYFQAGKSLAQNLDAMFFEQGAPMQGEFSRLFNSLFRNSSDYESIVRVLADHNYGLTRDEIASALEIKKGGGLTNRLRALEESDFIQSFTPVSNGRKEIRYQLSDLFSLFFLRFIGKQTHPDPSFWQNSQNLPAINVWKGLAFEKVCFNHIRQIKAALGISGVVSRESTFLVKGATDTDGSQIDMLIDRDDRVLNLCEMKFYRDRYEVTRDDFAKWGRQIDMLNGFYPKRNVHFTLISTYGSKIGKYSSIIQKNVTLDDLFQY